MNPQSTFVTVVAWLALIMSGLATVTGLLQSLVLMLGPAVPPMPEEEAAEVPLAMRIVFNNFQAIVFTITALWGATFASALGLLRRKEWGRRAFIVMLMVFTLGAAVVGVAQQIMMSQVIADGAEAPDEARTMMMAMRIGSAIFALVFTGAFGWVAFRLMSPRVREEFQAAGPQAQQ